MSARQTSSHPQDYLAFLRERPGADLSPAKEQDALERIKSFLSNLMSEENRRQTARVYAADAFFNDTLKTEIGAAAIEKYFNGTAANAEKIDVEFEDVARSGNDYYLRWVMDVEFKKFQRNRSFRSIGMTHIRFDSDGKVILHQDYWDSTAGFFQHLPVLGGGIRWVKSLF